MTPRIERRRPGGGEDGDRSGPAPRGGKPSRFSGPKRDWRGSPTGGSSGSGGSAGNREGRDNDRRAGGEGRPARVIPARPGARRADSGDRPGGAKPAYGKPAFGKPAYGKPAYGKPSFADKPSFGGKPTFGSRPGSGGGGRPSFADRSGDKPSFGRKPSFGGKPAFGGRPSYGDKPPFGDRPSFGGRPSSGGRPSFGGRPSSFDRPARGGGRPSTPAGAGRDGNDVLEPSGESDRFGVEPAEDMVWGRHPALAALEAERPIHRIWCTPELRFAPRFLQLLREAKAGGVLVEEVTWARLGQITGGAVHQGIVLQAAAAETLDLGTLIEGCRGLGEPPLLMAVDGLTDPHNLGAIVRSAEALGAHGLVLPQRRNAGLTGSVAKVAAGALEHLPVAKVINLNRSLEQLKDEGYRVVGLAEEGTVSLIEADLDGPLVVVTGSESQGLSMLTRKHCDQLIRIPLRGATPSLNASVATALLLYEVARRGWMKSITGTAPAPRLVRPQLPSKAAASGAKTPAADASSTDIEPFEEGALALASVGSVQSDGPVGSAVPEAEAEPVVLSDSDSGSEAETDSETDFEADAEEVEAETEAQASGDPDFAFNPDPDQDPVQTTTETSSAGSPIVVERDRHGQATPSNGHVVPEEVASAETPSSEDTILGEQMEEAGGVPSSFQGDIQL
ncbi:23S rRNA (guanosine(2251)-2'-O)-methyltransferase RlmB [Synechococcus sp. CS-603]|uniref:23S rRNA (guanosine(2251)-2'-O)-methyltransferase RlmB n=1 Tax=Synechococcus sp. CS-603 TaxID=2847981 RepID=UPI00223ABCD7|nr:23S rRNA (guanosine(2251)-2'-O)-methyltransferase RlmB [Synechococcus sp. CS-603]